MKHIKNTIFLIGIFFIGGYSCKKGNGPIDYFPSQIGFKWIYNVFDSISNTSETLKISIVGSKSINGVKSNVWVLNYSHHTDTILVSERNDTVIFIGYNSTGYTRRMYVIPFSVNQSWDELESSTNQSKVMNLESVIVAAGHFNDCYVIERKIESFNYSLQEIIYFKPYIGIIKIYTKEFNMAPYEIHSWELINYSF